MRKTSFLHMASLLKEGCKSSLKHLHLKLILNITLIDIVLTKEETQKRTF